MNHLCSIGCITKCFIFFYIYVYRRGQGEQESTPRYFGTHNLSALVTALSYFLKQSMGRSIKYALFSTSEIG